MVDNNRQVANKIASGSPSKIRRLRAEEIVSRISTLSQQNFGTLSPVETQRIFHELQVYQIEFEMQNEELRRIQIELDAERERYFDLYNMAPVGYCTLSEQGLILQANFTAATLFGVSQSELINQPITRFITKENQGAYYLYHKQFSQSDKTELCELRMVRNDGIEFWAHLEATGRQNSNHISEYHLIVSNITKHVSMKETLRLNENIMLAQSQKASMGELISMIAHQWRQPLNNLALINQDTYIKLELGKLDDLSIYNSHEKIDGILQFMSKTIDDFRNFFMPDQPEEWVTIADVLSSALNILGQCFNNQNIKIVIQNNSQTPCLIHKNSLVQVFLNILNNAKNALEANSVNPAAITITIDEIQQSLVVTIGDNGGGIPKNIVDKIGQPYFTTKGLMGTGLGLYISQTIIEKYFSGTLTWYNKPEGACFVITLNINKR